MTPDADIVVAPDPRIAMAEMWLCMLGGLREVAKRFSRFLAYEIMPFGPCPNGRVLAFHAERDPVAAMKRVTRALRFAALLYLKIQKQIAAWKAGVAFDLDAFILEAPRVSARSKSRPGAAKGDGRDGDEPDWDEDEWEDYDEVENLLEWESPERFDVLEGWGRAPKEDKYQALLRGPLKDAIAAICADLGLKPDWSLWTDKGFAAPPDVEIEDWVEFFVPHAVFAPRPGPDGSPVDNAAYKGFRRRWYPEHIFGRPPPRYGLAARPPDRGGVARQAVPST